MPRYVLPQEGGPIPAGPVEPVETQEPTQLQRVAKALAGKDYWDIKPALDQAVDPLKGFLGIGSPLKVRPKNPKTTTHPSCNCLLDLAEVSNMNTTDDNNKPLLPDFSGKVVWLELRGSADPAGILLEYAQFGANAQAGCS